MVDFSHVGRGDTEYRTTTGIFRAFGEGVALPRDEQTERYNSTFFLKIISNETIRFL